MYTFDGVVLNKKKIRDNRNLISIFSKDYGKISAWQTESKTKSIIDIGNIYNFSAKNDNGINKIDSYKTKVSINIEKLSYLQIINILDLCSCLEKILPIGSIYEGIYKDYLNLIKFLENPENNNQASLYFTLKLLKLSGIAQNPEKTNININFNKIFSVIDIYNMDILMGIKGLTIKDFEIIKKYNKLTLNNYLN